MNAKQITVAKPLAKNGKAAPKVSKATQAVVAAILADEAKQDAIEEVNAIRNSTSGPVAPVAEQAPATPAPQGIRFAIAQSARPGSGALLAAHTAVFLAHSGIDKTPMPTATVRTIIGDTALSYHSRAGNFATVGDKRDESGNVTQRGGVILTDKGREVFAKRKPNPEFMSAFENMLVRGELDDRTGIKNASLISQIAK